MEPTTSGMGVWGLVVALAMWAGAGLPPGERDRMLLKAAPDQVLVYGEWTAPSTGEAGAPGVVGLAADPEIVALREMLDSALRRKPADSDEAVSEYEDDSARAALRLYQLAVRHPGCLFVGEGNPPVEARAGISDAPPQGPPAGRTGPLSRIPFKKAQVALILRPGDDADEMVGLFNQLFESIDGFDATARPQGQLIPTGVTGVAVTYHREGNDILLTTGEGTLDATLARMKSSSAGSVNPRLEAALKGMHVERPGRLFWIDSQRIQSAIVRNLGPLGRLTENGFDAFGLAAIDSWVSVTGLTKGELVSESFLATRGKVKGLLAVTGEEPITARSFDLIPADARLVAVSQFSPRQLVAAARRGATQALGGPQIPDEFIKQLDAELGMPLDDALRPFGTTWTVYSSPGVGHGTLTGIVAGLNVVSAKDAPAVFDRLLGILRDSLGETDESGYPVRLVQHPFGNQTIHTIARGGYGSGMTSSPSFCLTENQLLFALHPQSLKAHLRFLGSDAPRFAGRLKGELALPAAGTCFSYSYLDSPAVMQEIVAVWPWLAASVALPTGGDEEGGAGFFLPSGQAILPYVRPSVNVLVREEAGYRLTCHRPLPWLALAGTAYVARYSLSSPWEHEVEVFGRRAGKPADALQPKNVIVAAHEMPAPDGVDVNGVNVRPALPFLLRAYTPDGVEGLIPPAVFERLQNGPSPEAIERREQRRQERLQRREMRQRQRFEPLR